MALVVGQASAQVLTGQVVDGQSGAPVAAAVIRLHLDDDQPLAAAVSDSSGAFRLTAPRAGTFRITIEAIGYARDLSDPVVIEDGAATNIVIRATAEAVRLEPITPAVDSRVRYLERVGFYSRQQYETGRFIARADIENRNPRRIVDMLRGIAGVRLVESGNRADVIMRGGNMTTMGARGEAGRTQDGLCAPEVYLGRA